MAILHQTDWQVTESKLSETLRRLVRAVDPLAVIVFGSRARGQHRPDSDLDLAVILDVPEEKAFQVVPTDLFHGIDMPIDLLPISSERYNRFRPWINSVHHNIDKEGIRLYERGAAPAGPATLNKIC